MTKQIDTKLLIIGSGPAGYSAAIYAARAALEPVLIQGMQPGGQLTITTDVENYPGFSQTIQGPFLMQEMQQQAAKVGTKLVEDYVEKVDLKQRPFTVHTAYGNVYTAQSIIISTGAQAKWLGLESESKYQGFGVSGCATCDGFFFKDQVVAIVGGGNSAVEEALYMTNHASKIYVIHRRDQLRAEKIMQNKLLKHEKITMVWDSVVEEILGVDQPVKGVTGIRVKNIKDGTEKNIDCSGVFVAIGHTPNTAMFKGQLDMDAEGYIITAADSTKTNIPGIFAAGDVQDKIYRQAVTAAGTGCMAALEANKFLNE